MTEQGSFPIDQIRRIIEAVDSSDATEVEVRTPGGLRIHLKKNPVLIRQGPDQPISNPLDTGQVDEYEDSSRFEKIIAPMGGIFYVSLRPDQPPLVTVGGYVENRQQVGIIEAMKVMNEVLSTAAGQVVKIADNKVAIEAGTPLVVIDKTQRPQEVIR